MRDDDCELPSVTGTGGGGGGGGGTFGTLLKIKLLTRCGCCVGVALFRDFS